ncbi:acyl-CoA dehydrogenase domain-containing protein [Aquabacterium sp.]|uniref:acyl-CoA dehydrogenase domain-containing protein n=1 Tax=Aquabacterium sp. TaxID=1872578 RepID=UPI0024871565|nr:acyl-CoA dehydrogenase domain-containing protein [Aquabacterium sp.]MDI1260409.1 DUF1974 domain-containing protein [Aquabacterium sp.]
MHAIEVQDEQPLGQALWSHVWHVVRNLRRSVFGAALIGRAPADLKAEAQLITRLSTQYSFTADLAMGLLGGQLKRMELLSARLGDVLAHLYIASACLWRYQVDGKPELLPFAQAGIRQQLNRAHLILQDLHANLPSAPARWMGGLSLRATGRLHPLRNEQRLALAELLRTRSDLVGHLCPDLSLPKQGGQCDLVKALSLGAQLGEDTGALNKVLRRTQSMETAAQSAKNPALALRYLQAADRVIQVDDVAADRATA